MTESVGRILDGRLLLLLLLSCGLCDVGVARDALCVALALLLFFSLLATRCRVAFFVFVVAQLVLLGLGAWKRVAQSICVLLTPYPSGLPVVVVPCFRFIFVVELIS